MPLELKNKWTRFCSISVMWNHITTARQDGCFWSSEVNWGFFWKKSSEAHLHGCLCSFTGDSQSLFAVIIRFSSALKSGHSLRGYLWQLRTGRCSLKLQMPRVLNQSGMSSAANTTPLNCSEKVPPMVPSPWGKFLRWKCDQRVVQ